MRFEVVIPTRWNLLNLEKILKSIVWQSFLPSKIYIIIDKLLEKTEFEELKYFLSKWELNQLSGLIQLITNLNSDFIPNKGVSYVRNFWIKLIKEEFLYMIDDDNIFWKDFFEITKQEWLNIFKINKRKFLLSPTIQYRTTDTIQSRGIKWFNYILSKVILNKEYKDQYTIVKMMWWNSLFWPAEIFKSILFDEEFKFVYEDIDFTYRCSLAWYPIIVSNIFSINHMERTKNIVEKSFIWNYYDIYQKSKNRIIFVKKNWTIKEKMQFYLLWLWIQSFWFLYLIIFYWNNKLQLYKAMIKWLFDWLIYNVK